MLKTGVNVLEGGLKMQLYEYEKKHNLFLRENGAECAVLLKKDGSFPLEKPCKIAAYGGGVRHTIKGGTGSGEVNSRYFVTIEDGLKEAGFEISSSKWLEQYDVVKENAKKEFVLNIKKEARKKHTLAIMIAMGRSVPEPEYDIATDAEGDTAIYVLSRISGEGSDREAVKGEILLTETEKRDIRRCNEKYKNFMLVLNTGGVVDLSEVADVKNILILSQLGVETGNILADLLLGRTVPSGKLTTTWNSWEKYPSIVEFGNKDDTKYKEGIYVGYRYFSTIGDRALFPFGYGLSYTDFSMKFKELIVDDSTVTVSVSVKNIGMVIGKETVQLYLTIPEGKLDQPSKVLAGFAKTEYLKPGEEQDLKITYDIRDFASYDVDLPGYILESGNYIHHLGFDSVNTEAVCYLKIEEDIICARSRNLVTAPKFSDYKPDKKEYCEDITNLISASLDKNCIKEQCFIYDIPGEIDRDIKELSDEQLIKLNLGAFDTKDGIKSVIGNAGFTVAGAAGQTSLEVEQYGIPSLVMTDGPAGLRLSEQYVKDKDGRAHSLGMSLPESFVEFLPKPFAYFMKLTAYKAKASDEIGYQYATAIPIGTAIAQSFNLEFAKKCGDIVGTEMEHFGVNLWLAPALNIHRSIQCGRNYEYFSEDPVLSGEMAAAITLGVQEHPGCGTTLKHFACNNQELNRTQNNSIMSERTLREIYLKGFGIAIRKSQPKAIMSSYNLLNGIHTGEHKGLIEDYLRTEQGFKGLVMTDWVIAGYASDKTCVHPISEASKVIMAGGDLFMPGSKGDYKNVEAGLSAGIVTRKQLMVNATRVSRIAKEMKIK